MKNDEQEKVARRKVVVGQVRLQSDFRLSGYVNRNVLVLIVVNIKVTPANIHAREIFK